MKQSQHAPPRHRASRQYPSVPARMRGQVRRIAALTLVLCLCLLPGGDANFTSTTRNGVSFAALSLNDWLPTGASTTPDGQGRCTTTWAAVAGAPGALRYDVLSGASVLAAGAAGTSATYSLPSTGDVVLRASIGSWTSSDVVAAGSCPALPAAPQHLATRVAGTMVDVAWDAPAFDGGSPVTGYTASASPGGGTCTADAPDTSCTLTGLTPGTGYTVEVTARNAAGVGPASSTTVTMPADATAARVALWSGSNATRQAGNGSDVDGRSLALGVARKDWISYSLGKDQACGVASAGTLLCWGSNARGQAGLGGSVTSAATPAAVDDNTWTSVSAGDGFSCGIRARGSLWCWGENGDGQLGTGSTASVATPSAVSGGGAWTQVAAGSTHACAIRTSGTLWCWGENGVGQLGVGDTAPRRAPTRVGTATWSSVVVGDRGTCGLQDDGSLWCWGDDSVGQLGTGSPDGAAHPVPGQVTAGVTYRAVAASFGGASLCAVRSEGSLWCWGRNTQGQLGTGDTDASSSPRQVGSDTDWRGVAVGAAHACAHRDDGSMWCWGDNSAGQLGLGDTTSHSTPVQVPGLTGWHVQDLRLGATTTAALSQHTVTAPEPVATNPGDRTLGVTWNAPAILPNWVTGYTVVATPGGATCSAPGSATGCTLYGLDNGRRYTVTVTANSTTNTATSPSTLSTELNTDTTSLKWAGTSLTGEAGAGVGDTRIPARLGDATYTSLTGGDDFACAMTSARRLLCWGDNSHGQLGLGDTVNQIRPVAVDEGDTWTAVAAGSRHMCAVRSDGTLWCTGDNSHGQLGLGTTGGERTTLSRVGSATDWSTVTAGDSHTCATRSTGALYCWGVNSYGQLGTGTTTDTATPDLVPGSGWRSVVAGADHTCAVSTAGRLSCWGRNDSGQVGNGSPTATGTGVTSPAAIGTATWNEVRGGGRSTCGIRTDATLWCWGLGDHGRLGVGSTTSFSTPQSVGGSYANLTVGDDHACAVRTDATVWCWGHNNRGQLGLGTYRDQQTPARVATYSGLDTARTAPSTDPPGPLFAGTTASCALAGDATVWCWGWGTVTGRSIWAQTPRDSGASAAWASLKMGDDTACGIRSDRSLWCWGNNEDGTAGQGDHVSPARPAVVADGTTWDSVGIGFASACGIRTDRSLWCWGRNNHGQLGLGDTAERTTPARVGSESSWQTVQGGQWHTCAVKTDGTLWCWGLNYIGQLGTGDTTSRSTPVQVGTDSDWTGVTGGADFTCALKRDTSLWCWGDNEHGQLGTGDTTARSTPTRVTTGDDGWAAMGAGNSNICASRDDGSLWCWGVNDHGQLGVGDQTDRSIPTRVGDGNDWGQPFLHGDVSFAKRADGSLWTWGVGWNWQSGLDSSANAVSPTRMPGVSARLVAPGITVGLWTQ